ncbi:MAG TPA: 50S ribosomal protein L24 [Solirubrobacterales bacterium]|nr:50S ribosomal protein L24 [Solirubrobacterales bacterium]
MKIRTDDSVQIMAGKDSGKQGKVTRTDPKKQRVYVEGLNMIKRHQRAQPSASGQGPGVEGGIIEKEGPIHVSNVMLLDPKDNKPTRVGIRTTDDGKRQRYSKRSGEAI